MKNPDLTERPLVIDILTRAFDANRSVNYIVRQDSRRPSAIRALMAYSYDLCRMFGEVFVSADRQACALILYPDRKKTTPRSVLCDLRLIIRCIGLRHLARTLKREALLHRLRPREPMLYLWFIGVNPACQHQGIGTRLLETIIEKSRREKRPVFLETSTGENLPWYAGFGFERYHEADLGYRLHFLKRPLQA